MSPGSAKKRTGCLKYVVLVLALAVVAGLTGSPRKRPLDSPPVSSSPAEPDETSGARPAAKDSQAPPMPSIPGLMPVDVYGNLTSKGFTKAGPKPMPDGLSVIDCKRTEGDASYHVEIWMKGNAVRSVIVNATSDAGDPTRNVGVLSFLATIPYEGSRQADAKAWVEEMIGSDAKKSFGPAVYRLWSNPGGHMTTLRIDAEGYEPN
jgi:hypothetical protein